MPNGFLETVPKLGLPSLLLFCALLPIIYVVGLITYNIYFHPLSRFPSSKIAVATPLWWVYHTCKGDAYAHVLALHEKYGEIVRVSPNELNFTNPEAWKDIYGHRPNNIPENPKDPLTDPDSDSVHKGILSADQEHHRHLRKLLSNAFSDKGLRSQEDILQHYVDKLILRLTEFCEKGEHSQDMVRWYTFTTFDIIGHLTFDESFDCLENSSLHQWVKLVYSFLKRGAYWQAFSRIPSLKRLASKFFISKSIRQNAEAHRQLTVEKVLRRKQRSPEYIDFMAHLIQAEAKGSLTLQDLCLNANILIVAGSETTATLLSGGTYYLLSRPNTLAKLVKEIRSSFDSEKEITIESVNGLNYMLACLNESLRMYPPAPTPHQRIIPPQGAMICGKFIPGGTSVGMSQVAVFRTSRNWAKPTQFIPERWLDDRDAIFANDNRDALQPFHVGPRACIGKNLAFIEARLILAKLLWNFDLEFAKEHQNWPDQEISTMWNKPPLMVKLTRVIR